jgi:hypothetical protein
MKLAEKLLNLHESLSKKDYEVIAGTLHNDENSTDSEIVDFLADEVKADKAKLSKLVKAERNKFLGPAYSNNSIEQDIKIIKKYV